MTVSRQYLLANRRDYAGTQTLTVSISELFGKVVCWLGERCLFRFLFGNACSLLRHLYEQDLGWHQAIFHTLAHLDHDFFEDARELAQASDVVVVVFNSGKGEGSYELGHVEMNTAKLRNRHFPVFKLCSLESVAQVTHHEVAVELFLFWKTGRVNRLKLFQENFGLT